MTIQIFSLETIDSPTGRMRIITNDEGRLLSVDWADHEARMMKLLERHFGTNSFSLRGELADVGGCAGAGGGFWWRHFCGRQPAGKDQRHRIPTQSMGGPPHHPGGAQHQLWRVGGPDRSSRCKPRCGACQWGQSHCHCGALSPRDRRRRVADRLWRRSRAQAMAACA